MDDAKVVAHAPNQVVADEICEVLRQAGIRCGTASVPESSNTDAILGQFGRTQIGIFVDDGDVDRARAALATSGLADA